LREIGHAGFCADWKTDGGCGDVAESHGNLPFCSLPVSGFLDARSLRCR
jgi:hypothetical protein